MLTEELDQNEDDVKELTQGERVQKFLAMMAFAKVHSWKSLCFNQPNQEATYITPAGIIVTIEKAKTTNGNLVICNDYRSVEMERE